MRLDKFLKVSRIIKRRTLSKEISQSEAESGAGNIGTKFIITLPLIKS